jgi:hypothetical protein
MWPIKVFVRTDLLKANKELALEVNAYKTDIMFRLQISVVNTSFELVKKLRYSETTVTGS